MNKQALNRYSELKKVISEAESELSLIKSDVFNSLIEAEEKGFKELEVPLGVFTLTKRRTYAYPDNIIAIENELSKKFEELESLQEEAKQSGTATYQEKPLIRFTINKE